jgi:hypothetical protein
MFETNDTRTLLMLPDGRQLEWTPASTAIRRFKRPDRPYPYGFDIDGQRYRVEGITDFAHLPSRDGAEAGPTLVLELVAYGPPAN